MQKNSKKANYIDFTLREMGVCIKKIENLTLGELAQGYQDNSLDESGGVFAWNNKLNIRPKFQRVYVVDGNKKWKAKLLDSVIHGLPIGLIYFGIIGDGKKSSEITYLVLDGQQRLMTICEFINNECALPVSRNGVVKDLMFSQLTDDEQRLILNYKPYIHCVTGTEEALLEWFITINQQIAILTNQELRNSAYNGPFVEAAKKIFCKVRASQMPTFSNAVITDKESQYYFEKYTKGKQPERCDVLEVALDWLSYDLYPELRDTTEAGMDERIRRYMYEHRDDTNADELLGHYKKVYDWVMSTFKSYQKCMKKVNWGRLYTEYHTNNYDLAKLNLKVNELMGNEEITANSAVFEFVLMGCPEEKATMLVPRNFKERDKDIQFELQGGLDPITMEPLLVGKGKNRYCAHHMIPFLRGGQTTMDNIILINPETHSLIHNGCEYTPKYQKERRDALMEWVKENKTK